MLKPIVTAIVLMLVLRASAHAQGLTDAAIGAAVGAGSEFGVLAAPPVNPNIIATNLRNQGYTNFSIPAFSPGMPYQFSATSPAGTPVSISVDPRTGGIISAVPQ